MTGSPCPDPLSLARASEETLAHAADCGSCRRALADLAALKGLEGRVSAAGERAALRAVPQARRPLWIPLAAAGLLLAAGLSVLGPLSSGKGRSPALGPSIPASIPSFGVPGPDGLLEASAKGTSLVLGQSAALSLREGSRIRVRQGPGEAATLLEGALWLEDPGEPLTLRAGGALVEVERAELLLETLSLPEASGASWVREALAAGEGRVRLAVLSGSAHVGALRISAGEEVLLGSEGPGEVRPLGPLPWRGAAGWRRMEGLPAPLKEGAHSLAPGTLQDAYVWEAVFRRMHPAAGASVRLAAGGQGWEVPLGAPLGAPGTPVRLRLEVRGGWVRLTAGSYEILRRPGQSLAGAAGLDPADPRCGLKVWGGDLELAESRWRSLEEGE